VVLYRMCGYLDASFVPIFEAAAKEEVAKGLMVDLFFDTDTMTGNRPDFRRRMTEWHKALKPRTRSLNVYVHSRMIAMSISVVNLFIGGILKPYTTRHAFDAAIAAAVAAAAERRVTAT